MAAFVFPLHSNATFTARFETLVFTSVSFFAEDLVALFTALEAISWLAAIHLG